MVDLDVINTVLKKFKSAPRQPKFLKKPEYKHIKEKNKEIFLSSAYYKSHHTYDRVDSYANSVVNGKPYFVCSMPYQIAIKEDLLDREEQENEMQDKTFDEIKWMMEMESLFYGQSTKSIFQFEDLIKARKLKQMFYPKEQLDLIKSDRSFHIPKHEHKEIRVISADIAVMSGRSNDATAITVARLIEKTNGSYDREIVYLETMEGVRVDNQALRIKQLYQDFDCDYIVIDRAGAGIGVYDMLTAKTDGYEPYSCMNDENLAARCTYPNAKKVIYAINATADLNSEIAIRFKDALNRGRILLPSIEFEGIEHLLKSEKYKSLPLETQEQFKMPYVQANFLVNEILNLEADINKDSGKVRLTEARSGRKDRYSSIAYLNFFATEMELKLRRDVQDIDVTKLFMVRKPKLY